MKISITNDTLTLIPARSGSKGIPGKNIKLLEGKPLIAWIISAVQEAGNAGRIVVTTDSEEIAMVAKEWGAEVPFMRPASISADLSTDLEFVLHALDFFEAEEKWSPKVVARFSPVTPLVPPSVIAETIDLLLSDPTTHSVRPISVLSHHPYKSWRIEGEYIVPAFGPSVTGVSEPHNLPRQVLPEFYAHLGAAGVAWTETYSRLKSTSGDRVRYLLMDAVDAFDINHPLDFEIAANLMRKKMRVAK